MLDEKSQYCDSFVDEKQTSFLPLVSLPSPLPIPLGTAATLIIVTLDRHKAYEYGYGQKEVNMMSLIY